MTTTRRTFFLHSLASATALSSLALTNAAMAQSQTAVTEDDPQALALGYKTDATKTDAKKYPGYSAVQSCSGCALFQGKSNEESGSCAVYGNRQVASKGWCSVWAKKP